MEALDGSTVSLPDITESIQDLSYVREAYIIAIPSVTGNHIAALVRLEKSNTTEAYLQGDDNDARGNHISIERIRSDLSKELRECELPTLLRVLDEHEPSPTLGPRRKVPKWETLEAYFTAKEEGGDD